MAKTILVCGFGPGISTAVAEKFGAEGFSVALVARSEARLAEGVKALGAKGVKAAAFPTDLADPKAAAALVGKVRASLGPVTVIHWNAYAGGAGDLLAADAAQIHTVLDVAVTSLVATVNAALPEMKKAEGAAVLVTNGGFGAIDSNVDAACVQYGAMGLSLANAAKNKLVGLLAEKLRADGIYVGQLMVNGTVKGTAFDNGQANLDPRAIAERFWALYRGRTEVRAQIA